MAAGSHELGWQMRCAAVTPKSMHCWTRGMGKAASSCTRRSIQGGVDVDALFTQETFDNGCVDSMALTDDDYRDNGITVVARLLAFNGLIR